MKKKKHKLDENTKAIITAMKNNDIDKFIDDKEIDNHSLLKAIISDKETFVDDNIFKEIEKLLKVCNTKKDQELLINCSKNLFKHIANSKTKYITDKKIAEKILRNHHSVNEIKGAAYYKPRNNDGYKFFLKHNLYNFLLPNWNNYLLENIDINKLIDDKEIDNHSLLKAIVSDTEVEHDHFIKIEKLLKVCNTKKDQELLINCSKSLFEHIANSKIKYITDKKIAEKVLLKHFNLDDIKHGIYFGTGSSNGYKFLSKHSLYKILLPDWSNRLLENIDINKLIDDKEIDNHSLLKAIISDKETFVDDNIFKEIEKLLKVCNTKKDQELLINCSKNLFKHIANSKTKYITDKKIAEKALLNQLINLHFNDIETIDKYIKNHKIDPSLDNNKIFIEATSQKIKVFISGYPQVLNKAICLCSNYNNDNTLKNNKKIINYSIVNAARYKNNILFNNHITKLSENIHGRAAIYREIIESKKDNINNLNPRLRFILSTLLKALGLEFINNNLRNDIVNKKFIEPCTEFPISKIVSNSMLLTHTNAEYTKEQILSNHSNDAESSMDKSHTTEAVKILNRVKKDYQKDFLSFSKKGNPDEALKNVETQIRKHILEHILKSSQAELKTAKKTDTKTIEYNKNVINFIKDNDKKLLEGDEKALDAARKLFTRNDVTSQIAWRAYDPKADCVEWPNLFTTAVSGNNDTVFTTQETANSSQLKLDGAIKIVREHAAYTFVAMLKEKNRDDLIENFIFYVSEIRRAHNSRLNEKDNPSCFPGTVSRIRKALLQHKNYPDKLDRLEIIRESCRDYIARNLIDYLKSLSKDKKVDDAWEKQLDLYTAVIQNDYDDIYHNKKYILDTKDMEFDKEWADKRKEILKVLSIDRAKSRVNKMLEKHSLPEITKNEEILVVDALYNIGNEFNLPSLQFSFYNNIYKPAHKVEEVVKSIVKSKELINPFKEAGYGQDYKEFKEQGGLTRLPDTFVKNRYHKVQVSGDIFEHLNNITPKKYKANSKFIDFMKELVDSIVAESYESADKVTTLSQKDFMQCYNEALSELATSSPTLYSLFADGKDKDLKELSKNLFTSYQQFKFYNKQKAKDNKNIKL